MENISSAVLTGAIGWVDMYRSCFWAMTPVIYAGLIIILTELCDLYMNMYMYMNMLSAWNSSYSYFLSWYICMFMRIPVCICVCIWSICISIISVLCNNVFKFMSHQANFLQDSGFSTSMSLQLCADIILKSYGCLPLLRFHLCVSRSEYQFLHARL